MNDVSAVQIFLGLGSNIGDREVELQAAVDRIKSLKGVRFRKISPVYETEPWGYTEQAGFLNCVIDLMTAVPAKDLLTRLKNIEKVLGRQATEKNHPRNIDIDILFYGSFQIRAEGLAIPHPSIQNRRFVLVPLCDLAPEMMHPVLRKSLAQLLKDCPDTGSVTKTDIILTM